MLMRERIPLRVLAMECCGHVLCYVNPRLPNYCPECGQHCQPAVRGWVTFIDEDAQIVAHDTEGQRPLPRRAVTRVHPGRDIEGGQHG